MFVFFLLLFPEFLQINCLLTIFVPLPHFMVYYIVYRYIHTKTHTCIFILLLLQLFLAVYIRWPTCLEKLRFVKVFSRSTVSWSLSLHLISSLNKYGTKLGSLWSWLWKKKGGIWWSVMKLIRINSIGKISPLFAFSFTFMFIPIDL